MRRSGWLVFSIAIVAIAACDSGDDPAGVVFGSDAGRAANLGAPTPRKDMVDEIGGQPPAPGPADAAIARPRDATGPPPISDAAPPPMPDAAPPTPDAGLPSPDAAPPPIRDAAQPSSDPDPGFGEITGACRVLDTELTDELPHFFRNTLDFGGDPYDDADEPRLTAGGREIIADGNAGGNSILSEVFAFELLARCEDAILLKTENEVEYVAMEGGITDMLVELDGTRIGVSVTRAVGFPREDPYTFEQAVDLLTRKLEGVIRSSANVAPVDAWPKQILHVLAYAPAHADALHDAWESLESNVLADTIVIVTVTEGDDDPLY